MIDYESNINLYTRCGFVSRENFEELLNNKIWQSMSKHIIKDINKNKDRNIINNIISFLNKEDCQKRGICLEQIDLDEKKAKKKFLKKISHRIALPELEKAKDEAQSFLQKSLENEKNKGSPLPGVGGFSQSSKYITSIEQKLNKSEIIERLISENITKDSSLNIEDAVEILSNPELKDFYDQGVDDKTLSMISYEDLYDKFTKHSKKGDFISLNQEGDSKEAVSEIIRIEESTINSSLQLASDEAFTANTEKEATDSIKSNSISLNQVDDGYGSEEALSEINIPIEESIINSPLQDQVLSKQLASDEAFTANTEKEATDSIKSNYISLNQVDDGYGSEEAISEINIRIEESTINSPLQDQVLSTDEYSVKSDIKLLLSKEESQPIKSKKKNSVINSYKLLKSESQSQDNVSKQKKSYVLNCLIGGCLGLITACFMGPEIFFAAIALTSVGVVIGYNVTRLSDDQIKTKINNPCIEQSQLLANTTSK